MTGSEPANTAVSSGEQDKTREEIEQRQEKKEELNLQSADTSSEEDTQKLDPLAPSNSESSPSPELKKESDISIKTEPSPSPELKKDCDISIKITEVCSNISSRPKAVSRLNSGSSRHRMKRTTSNCNVRNTSTLCSKDSSYVYHCPARKRNQRIIKSLVPDANSPQSTQDKVSSQFHLMLMEDSSSDETQSMVEMGSQPFRMRGQCAGSSLRKSNNLAPHQRTPQHGTGTNKDHLLAMHAVTKQPGQQGQMGTNLSQYSSHLALERVHSVSGGRIPGGQQEQMLVMRQRSTPQAMCHSHQSRPFTQQGKNSHLQQHPLNYKHGMGHAVNSTTAARPHPQTGHHSHALTRVMSVQVPRVKTSSAHHRVPESRVQLHVPSGRKLESLV